MKTATTGVWGVVIALTVALTLSACGRQEGNEKPPQAGA